MSTPSGVPAPGAVQQPLERVVIVDADNRVVGATTRAEMRVRNLIHRASFTFVHNSRGQLFVQRRVAWKETYPSHFDPAPVRVLVGGGSPPGCCLPTHSFFAHTCACCSGRRGWRARDV